ncbi:Class II abasic (AP) endonuclease [Xylographa vitiligo]|nr:Class II abasic (AP) endonuclease [Xylographa vitiligo]
MFDILEADIVVFQETKIQQKDLRDDMVLVPGWDCFFSMPKHKKGYSGIVIYTRQSVCCPVRAEEGISGVLCPSNSSTSFSDLPEDQQIGGYPTLTQASDALDSTSLATDFVALDSEGRSVILEFPAFVLVGVYSPANRDETRDDFRLGFLNLLDIRVRNLVSMGKRVFLTGDLNISREELDTANAESAMRKNSMTTVEYFSTPTRRLFNQLLEDGKVYGERDHGRERAVLWDICRGFHPLRKGMFTCWEQKVNARPGNFGARIDYVLCSSSMKDWFSDSNIQEGLMGSDHCPVYATMKDVIAIGDAEFNTKDLMNPPGMFQQGRRMQKLSAKDMLPLSGRLIPEFDRRQSIRDMFKRTQTLSMEQSLETTDQSETDLAMVLSSNTIHDLEGNSPALKVKVVDYNATEDLSTPKRPGQTQRGIASFLNNTKRQPLEKQSDRPSKRVKLVSTIPAGSNLTKGQRNLRGFFKNKPTDAASSANVPITRKSSPKSSLSRPVLSNAIQQQKPSTASMVSMTSKTASTLANLKEDITSSFMSEAPLRKSNWVLNVHDPIESKESWSKLFSKPAAPRCEGHNEPCISLVTKKSGINCGRSFWMCPRPLGPSGAKEKGTQWRCQSFVWCSDWNSKVD